MDLRTFGRYVLTPRRDYSPGARLAGLTAVAAIAAGVSARIYLVDPAEPGHYPSCPFRALTGWDCPGCGSLRGLHQLLHGQLTAAADHNVFMVVAVPALTLAWLVAVARAAGWRRRLPAVPVPALTALPILVGVFWVLRNLPLPVGDWLASGSWR
ncbi:Protein of unknown function (DUF2752) [Frankia sp. EI5c]|uniref:DUF2752 domain-containing protein n=1 Tax=Frankia sp. EI5c TaxID=683316 RepID=UPI0007C398CE|nr:DUF2752 domain-containing protein [Frankia sp. EI5c]OAA26223.1 Protein of unknown function (DUF2752) [Frankia sp. EI5c]